MRASSIVVAWIALTSVAHADRVHSFAYITHVDAESRPTSTTSGPDRCNVYALVPNAIVTTRPRDGDRSLLAAGSHKVTNRVKDPNDHCKDYLNTWQPVTFDPADPGDADIDWPQGAMSWVDILLGMLFFGVFVWAIGGRVRKKLAARRAKNAAHH